MATLQTHEHMLWRWLSPNYLNAIIVIKSLMVVSCYVNRFGQYVLGEAAFGSTVPTLVRIAGILTIVLKIHLSVQLSLFLVVGVHDAR